MTRRRDIQTMPLRCLYGSGSLLKRAVHRLRWQLYVRPLLRLAVARGWRASAYSGTYYDPVIYGVSIAWWDATQWNLELRTQRREIQAAIDAAEIRLVAGLAHLRREL